MSDGSKLKQSWYTALSDAEARFRQLLTSPAAEWKRLTHSGEASTSKQKAKVRPPAIPEVADVIVHRNSNNSGEDVYRMVLEVPTLNEKTSLEPWKAVLTTPELRQEWDPAVEDALLLEMFDRNTRISKTNYTLGWPANPRDSITISRAFYDVTTLIDITTSLPRSSDEPAYLRPSPPFVRSTVQLFAWCIQHIQPQPTSPTDDKKPASNGKLRITCFWQHDLKALWGLGSSTSSLTQQLSTMTLSLFKTVITRGNRVPKLAGYGNGVSIERVRYQVDREALSVDYCIIPDDEEHSMGHELGLQGMDEVHALREHRRLTRSIECVLPSSAGWDIQVAIKGSSDEVESIPWSAHAIRSNSNPSIAPTYDQVILRLTHGALMDDDSVLKVKVVIEVAGGTRGLRLNGLATKIHDVEERDPSSHAISQKMLQDVASAMDMSIQTSSSMGTVSSNGSSTLGMPPLRHNERTPAADKSILSKVKRNYIYFSSLLQEPEAKWRRTTEARGVSITQLDSIDPTLVVYRAEATFVGVGLWDLYAAVVSPGARVYWDKQHEDGVLLEDVNGLTELWHFKTKPAWPVNGRDAVVLKTVYKSTTTIHVFSFSADDPHLFPQIPLAEPNVIRTQVDLQGWAIESLSPSTTLLTLLEQSDPKGWTNKTSIPTQMINTLAGIGEFAIKCGGPPVVTRLAGSKANEIRYDHERGLFKLEYEPSATRRSTGTMSPNNTVGPIEDSGLPSIECEIRCDIDTWGASLDVVVDPPPQTITCLRRHRLSVEGGGLWLTLTHDSVFLEDERLMAVVRRAPGKEKGLVMVNGAKVQVDVEELPDHEIKSLSKQKRVKPARIPLDQPPVMSIIRRRKAEWNVAEGEDPHSSGTTGTTSKFDSTVLSSAPRISSPLARFFTYAVDQATTTTQQAVAAISPANSSGSSAAILDPTKLAMQYALEALAWTQEFNSKPQTQEGWTMVSDKGMVVERKLIPSISPFIPVHKGFKVLEGVSAEEVAAIVTSTDCRKNWDERFDTARVLQSYGGQTTTSFLVSKAGFPFRDRGFYLANVVAREHVPSSAVTRRAGEVELPSTRNAIFCVSASFSAESANDFSSAKYNSYGLPIGRVYVDAWVLETLDPYTKENYTIPSSRCTRLVAVDYAGAIPAAFNSAINASLARSVLAVEAYIKGNLKAVMPLTRLPASGVLITERKPEEHGAVSAVSVSGGRDAVSAGAIIAAPFMAWKLRRRDDNRILLRSQFDAEKKIYRTSVLITMFSFYASSNSRREASTATIIPSTGSDASIGNTPSNEKTPRPGHLTLSESLNNEQSSDQSQGVFKTEATLSSKTSNSSSVSGDASSSLSTPMLKMPGAMAVTPLPSSTAFPSTSTSNATPGIPSHIVKSNESSSSVALSSPPPPSLSISPPRLRQRAASSGSSAFSIHSNSLGALTALYHPDGSIVRGRTTSSAFTNKGEVKPTTDLIVMEVVVDSNLFKDAGDADALGKGYTVDVRARTRERMALHQRGLDAVPLSDLSSGWGSTASGSPTSTNTGAIDITSSDMEATLDLPFIYGLYTMPSSPLHSSGLSAESPTRHLLRLILPTAQYRVSNVKDPLTGEMRTAPPKPAWMLELEKDKGGIVVELVVRPALDGVKGASQRVVCINGKNVPILGEKESLTSIGREELLDDRISRMGVLSRMPNDSEPLPEELKVPIAIADDLLLPATDPAEILGDQSSKAQPVKTDTDEDKDASERSSNSEDSPGASKAETAVAGGPHGGHAAFGGPGGLLGFFSGYPNPLTRFTGGSGIMAISTTSKPVTGGNTDGTGKLAGIDSAGTAEGKSRGGVNGGVAGETSAGTMAGAVQMKAAQQRGSRTYPLSSLIFVGLIAFLLGSLLRSLLSPADFIYVVTDLHEAEEGVSGWREIRRLVEIKYIVGGWDLQVAVVRRQ